MDYFNGLEQITSNCPKVGHDLYILQYEGDANSWKYSKRHNNIMGHITFTSFNQRKTASYKEVRARVFVYDGYEGRWYPVRRNTKGIYFNYGPKAYYLEHQPIPNSMR